MEWFKHKTMTVTVLGVALLVCTAIFAYFEVWAPPSELDLVALHILPAPTDPSLAPKKAPGQIRSTPTAPVEISTSAPVPFASMSDAEFLALLVDPVFSSLLDDLMFDMFLSARLNQLSGLPTPSLVTATALASLPLDSSWGTVSSALDRERIFDSLPDGLLTSAAFAHDSLPFDAPTVEFSLVLDVARDADWYRTHDMDMNVRLTPPEADILDRMRADITGPAGNVAPAPTAPSGAGGGGEGGPQPPNPPEVSQSRL